MNKKVLLIGAVLVLMIVLTEAQKSVGFLDKVCKNCAYCKTDPSCDGCSKCSECTSKSQVRNKALQALKLELFRITDRHELFYRLLLRLKPVSPSEKKWV